MSSVNRDILKRFNALSDLSDKQLELLSEALSVHMASAGQQLIKRGDTAAFSLFLLRGDLELIAPDGGRLVVAASSDSARNPIANLLPRRYDVKAVCPVEYFLLDSQLLEDLRASQRMLVSSSDDSVFYQTGDLTDLVKEIIAAIKHDLSEDRLRLPTDTSLAKHLLRAIETWGEDRKQLSILSQLDPVIAARLIKKANSLEYPDQDAVDQITGALDRIGLADVKKLILSVSLKDVGLLTSTLLRQRMQRLVEKSGLVAEIAAMICGFDGCSLDPMRARLTGLLHQIGGIAVLAYAEDYQELSNSNKVLDRIFPLLRGRVGAMILQYWRFPADMAQAVKQADKFTWDSGANKGRYEDLLIAANALSMIGTREAKNLPAISEIPAIRNIGLHELKPKQALALIDKAKVQLANHRAALFE